MFYVDLYMNWGSLEMKCPVILVSLSSYHSFYQYVGIFFIFIFMVILLSFSYFVLCLFILLIFYVYVVFNQLYFSFRYFSIEFNFILNENEKFCIGS